MRKYAESTIFSDTTGSDGKAIVVEVRSKPNPDKMYRVDLTHGRCSCPAWLFQKGGERKPCKHLRELGYTQVQSTAPEVVVAEPKRTSKKQKIAVTNDVI